LDLLRQDFVLEFKASGSDAVRDPARGLNTEFRPDLVEAYSKEAGDPEMHIFAWLRHGAPLGLHTPIPASGIFPPNNQAGGPPEEFEALTARVAATYTSFRNYSSMLGENDGLARGEVQRLLDGGFLHEFSSFEELKEYVMGDPLLNKLGLLIKEKSDGTVKLRLITDLRASMGNEFLTIPERIVLPRLQDAVEMILFLLHGLEEEQSAGGARGASVVIGSADIKDAFLNVPVLPSERRAQCWGRLPSSGGGWQPGPLERPRGCSASTSYCYSSMSTIPCGLSREPRNRSGVTQ